MQRYDPPVSWLPEGRESIRIVDRVTGNITLLDKRLATYHW